MQKALTGIVLLFISGLVHAQTWQYTSPNIGYFNYSGAKIGIGTANPQAMLHLVGNSSIVTGVNAILEATDDWYASLSLTSNNKTWQWSKRPSFENDALQLWYAAPGGWQGPYFTVTPNGSVGIGTVKTGDAGYKLFVETGIRTRKVVVDQATWPDYVFHPGYSLPSLPSLAAYIQLHHHLPDMPSADSVAKAGINLGDNQAQLLKKIEELTLYVINQDEVIRKQQDEIAVLKQQNERIEALQRQIDNLKRKL